MSATTATTAKELARAKAQVAQLGAAMYDYQPRSVETLLGQLFAADAKVRLAHPFEDLEGAGGWFGSALQPLAKAFPDLERRDTIRLAGIASETEGYWVGTCGYYTGTFSAPFLDIPPSGHQAAMRFHEFYRFEDGRIVEFQGLWDIPELMLHAGVWPMSPALGREWHVPAPATQDGLSIGVESLDSRDSSLDSRDSTARGAQSLALVHAMLSGLSRFAEGGVAAMQLEKYWHPHFSWYGPSGIGTGRGIRGFRNFHQIPFLNAMPDREGGIAGGLFAEGDYVAYTAWPGMRATISGDGWLGIAPSNQRITMRSLDFWRCENGMIRENWVLVDLLHVYHQIGVDVLARMRQLAGTD